MIHAVNGISFDVAPGETLGIVGESGCGKSVTSLALLGILPRAGRVEDGHARFEGRDLLALDDDELREVRGREIAMIFQDPMTSLNPVLTIGRQLREPLETHFGLDRREAAPRGRAPRPGGIPGAKTAARLPAPVLRRHAAARDDRDGARVRAQDPDRRRADHGARRDDPGSDPGAAARLVSERDTALIMITHDLGVVAGMCDRVNVMYAGMFMETGAAGAGVRAPAEPLHARPAAERAAPRRRAEAAPAPDRRRAARHAARPQACPFAATVPLRGRGVAQGACRRSRRSSRATSSRASTQCRRTSGRRRAGGRLVSLAPRNPTHNPTLGGEATTRHPR